jgi:hypothetical protein
VEAPPTPVKRPKKKAAPAKAAAKVKKVKKEGPKKASAYTMFCSDTRPSIVKKNADLTFGEVGKALGSAWGELSEKDKAAWKAKAEKQTAKNAADFKKKK